MIENRSERNTDPATPAISHPSSYLISLPTSSEKMGDGEEKPYRLRLSNLKKVDLDNKPIPAETVKTWIANDIASGCLKSDEEIEVGKKKIGGVDCTDGTASFIVRTERDADTLQGWFERAQGCFRWRGQPVTATKEAA